MEMTMKAKTDSPRYAMPSYLERFGYRPKNPVKLCVSNLEKLWRKHGDTVRRLDGSEYLSFPSLQRDLEAAVGVYNPRETPVCLWHRCLAHCFSSVKAACRHIEACAMAIDDETWREMNSQ